MKKNFIRAYTALNLGDDLFVKILCERYPNHQFYIISRKVHSIAFIKIKNLKVVYPVRYIEGIFQKLNLKFSFRHFQELLLTKYTDSYIHIGGSIFMQYPNLWEKKIQQYENIVDNSKNFFVLGSNFGPYETIGYLNMHKNIFKKIKDVSFRDKKSYDLFSDLDNVRLAPDIVFSLETNNIKKFNLETYVVVSVIDLTERKTLRDFQREYERTISKLCEKLISKGFNIVLMSFCKEEGDEEAILRIKKICNHPKVFTYFYNGNLDEAISIINSSHSVIATRFHSLVLAWVFNKPVLPFVYSEKTNNVLNDSDFRGYSVEISDIVNIDLPRAVAQLIDGNPHDITSERQDANKHFQELDKFMNFKYN